MREAPEASLYCYVSLARARCWAVEALSAEGVSLDVPAKHGLCLLYHRKT